MAGKAPRHRWHLRHSWHYGICNLQNLKDGQEFESHSLRHNLSFRINSLQAAQEFPVQRSVAAAFARAENRRGDRETTPIFYREFRLFCAQLWLASGS